MSLQNHPTTTTTTTTTTPPQTLPLLPTRIPPYLQPSPTDIDLNPYTPSLPCLHCRLVSSPRCSLLNLLDHRPREQPKRKPPLLPMWYMHYISKQDVPLPIPRLQTRCSRCVRDGVEWCVLRERAVEETVETVETDGEGGGEGIKGVEEWMMGGVFGKREEGVGGDMAGGNDADENKGSSESPLMARARRIRALRMRRANMLKSESEDEHVEGSPTLRRFGTKSGQSGKSAKFRFSTAKPGLKNWTSPPELGDYDAKDGGDASTDDESNPDPDASNSDSDDAKSNVSSKTSFSKRSVKSIKSTHSTSTTSPFLTPSSLPSSPPVKLDPELALPPPTPPEQPSDLFGSDSPIIMKRSLGGRFCLLPPPPHTRKEEEDPKKHEHDEHEHDDVLLLGRKREKYIWNLKEDGWVKEEKEMEEEEEKKGQVEVKRSSRKEFDRKEWRGFPLYAAVTAVEVGREDVMDLIDPEKRGVGGVKRFINEEVPFIAYVRSTGLEGEGKEEALLQIVRTQILDVILSYEETETRKKEALTAVEGYLPLEARPGGDLTQDDVQKQFALPSWRRKGLTLLSADVVELRRRKKMERFEKKRQAHEKREMDLMLERWRRRMGWGEGGGCEKRAEGPSEPEEKGESDEPDDEPQPQPSSSKESKTTPLTPNKANTKPTELQQQSALSPGQDPYTSDSDSDPENHSPSTPAEYFSRRRHRLHDFWTKEAQPSDFQAAKVIRQNTFRKWRGETGRRRRRKETSMDQHREKRSSKNTPEWVASLPSGQQQGQGQRKRGTSSKDTATRIATARSPVPVTAKPAAGGRTRRRKLTRQQLAEINSSFVLEEKYKEEEDWEGERNERLLADELLEVMTDSSDEEDILRLLGDGDDDDDDVGDERQDEDSDEDEDSYPLVDLVRESMMNEY
ncbi:hypothetical protein QBC32DRAFT_385350 [Pseudoneurospora amorphoporcata]|uniref:Uncharacterized protein n=1 Tax=Pseudoneurospora amorphoporcata TaxID=241081 RepID=A0AAN6P1R7_9PEZI|nr:hypothetical protein QBC32DRAFT_385350 [Pseudoneurospora amorphoporcata]